MTRALKADQVAPAFVSVPGVTLEAINLSPTGTQDINTDTFTDITEGTAEFYVSFAGKYVLRCDFWGTLGLSGNGNGRYQVRITGATTWTSPDTSQLQISNLTDERKRMITNIPVELNAGAHTIQLAYKRVGSHSTRFDTSMRYVAYLDLMSGSGAGGTLISQKEDTTDRSHTGAGTYTVIAALTHTITTLEGEDVHLDVVLNCYTSTGTTGTGYSGYRIDGGSWVRGGRASFPSTGRARNLSFSTALVGLSAGSHTIEVGFGLQEANTIICDNDQSAARSTLTQYRGGLVPWEVDGVSVIDTPRAINVDGATVDLSTSDGKLNLSLPKAVTAPGATAIAVQSTGAGTEVDDGTWHEFLSQTITPTVAGKHRVDLSVTTYAVGSTNGRFDFKLVFDEGGDDEVTVNGEAWYWRQDSMNTYKQHSYMEFATLAAKAQTVKAYCRRDSGGFTLWIAGQQYTQVAITSITGSGAGGNIIGEDALTSGYLITAAAGDPPTVAVPGLSMTIDCAVGESIRLVAQGIVHATGGATTTTFLRFAVDGTPISSVSTWGGAITASWREGCSLTEDFVATASQHTITLLAATGTASNHTLLTGFRISARQDRGGLVPFKQDNALVQDKPVAVNAVGPGLVAENVGGQVNLSVESAIEGVSVQEDTPGTQLIDTDEPSFEDITSETIDTSEGEWIHIDFQAYGAADQGGAVSARIRFEVDGTSSAQIIETIGSANVANLCASRWWGPLSAGSHTVKVQGAQNTGNPDWTIINPKMQVVRVRGGYVTPESAPVFERDASDTSMINAVAAPGAPDRMWMSFNDGVRRYADLPLTCDIDVDGIGGRDTGDATAEAADDLYHLYAVPSDVDGQQIKLVLSKDAVPGTSGPPSFSTYKYLWTVRIESIGPVVIEEFQMSSDGWYRPTTGNLAAYTLESYDGGTPGTGSWVSLTTALRALIPESADAVEVQGFMSSSGTQYVFIAGESSPSWTPASSQPYTQRFLGMGASAPRGQQTRVITTPNRELAVRYDAAAATWSTIQLGGYRNAMYPGAKVGPVVHETRPDAESIIIAGEVFT